MINQARIIAKLQHPNITQFHGLAADRQPVYLVMEFVNGGALNDFLEKNAEKFSVLVRYLGYCSLLVYCSIWRE